MPVPSIFWVIITPTCLILAIVVTYQHRALKKRKAQYARLLAQFKTVEKDPFGQPRLDKVLREVREVARNRSPQEFKALTTLEKEAAAQGISTKELLNRIVQQASDPDSNYPTRDCLIGTSEIWEIKEAGMLTSLQKAHLRMCSGCREIVYMHTGVEVPPEEILQ